MRSYDRIYDEYEDGTIAARDGDTYVVLTPDGEETEFKGTSDPINILRARLFAALYVQLDGVPIIDDKSVVPVSVALAGKPVIASYLFTVHASRAEQINWSFKGKYALAPLLDVQPETISKYHRRTLENAEDKRIGGEGR